MSFESRDSRSASLTKKSSQATHSSSDRHGSTLESKKVHVSEVLEELAEYSDLFVQAGYTLVYPYLRESRQEVNEILLNVEKANHLYIDLDIRGRLYKKFYTRWWKSPKIREQNPVQPLPPANYETPASQGDFQFNDEKVEFQLLDSERQRMIKRELVQDTRHKMIRQVQTELYGRTFEVVFKIKDMDRVVDEWTKMDPNMMLKEDPREEVFLERIRNLAKEVNFEKDRRIRAGKHQDRYYYFFLVLRLLFFSFAVGLLGLLYYRVYQSSSSKASSLEEVSSTSSNTTNTTLARTRQEDPDAATDMRWQMFCASRQHLAASFFFLASCVTLRVTQHVEFFRQGRNEKIEQFQVLDEMCRAMELRLVRFALKTVDQRKFSRDEIIAEEIGFSRDRECDDLAVAEQKRLENDSRLRKLARDSVENEKRHCKFEDWFTRVQRNIGKEMTAEEALDLGRHLETVAKERSKVDEDSEEMLTFSRSATKIDPKSDLKSIYEDIHKSSVDSERSLTKRGQLSRGRYSDKSCEEKSGREKSFDEKSGREDLQKSSTPS